MKKTAIMLILCLALFLAACQGSTTGTTAPPDTTVPETTAPAHTQPPETDPPETTVPETTVPPETPPAYLSTDWYPTDESETMSSGEFFSVKRQYQYSSSSFYASRWIIGTSGSISNAVSGEKCYVLYHDPKGFFIAQYEDGEFPASSAYRVLDHMAYTKDENTGKQRLLNCKIIREVPGSGDLANIDAYVTDGRWIYCVQNGTDLIRVDLLSGHTEKLLTFDRIRTDIRHTLNLYGNTVLYIVADVGENIGIHRLYLPEMKLELLYKDISADTLVSWFLWGIDYNHTIYWNMMNPKFQDAAEAALSDPNSPYKDSEWVAQFEYEWSIENIEYYCETVNFCESIANRTGLKEMLYCTYDSFTGAYTEVEEHRR